MSARRFRWLLGLLAVLAGSMAALADSPSSLTWLGSTEIARGRGERGPWHQNESRYDFVDDPSVAINSRGEIAVAWVDQARKAVLLQRFSPEGKPQFAKPVDVSRQPQTFSWLPRVAFAPDAPHSVFVLWQEIIFSGGTHGGDILFARSDDGGRTFAVSVNLSQSVGGDGKGRVNRQIWHNGSLDLVAAANGVVHAAWTEYDGPLWLSRSSDSGRSFSTPRRLAGGGQAHPARGPSLALGPAVAVYLAWTVGDDRAADIRVARSADGGVTFSEPQVVEPSKTYSDAPKLAVDSAGILHLVYAESVGGPFEPSQIQYTRSADGGRTFEPARAISSPMPASAVSAAFPALGIDDARNLYVVWELYQGTSKQPRGLGLAVSRDGGRTFARPGVVPDSMDPAGGFNGSSQGLLMKKLAVSRSGAVAIVNSSLKPNAHSRVWLIRGAMPPGR
jgi:BNR repeat protein